MAMVDKSDDIVPNLEEEHQLQHDDRSQLANAFIDAYRYGISTVDPDDPYATEEDADGQGGGGLTPCPVKIVGNLRQRQGEFQDKVQILRFDEFEGLAHYMCLKRDAIEKRHEPTLKELHETFRSIVQDILSRKKLYHSVLGEAVLLNERGQGDRPHNVGLYATPNVRLGRGRYANFLHSDAIFPGNSGNSINTSATSSSAKNNTTVAMINVWIVLNDVPPSNQLMFYETFLERTRQTHQLHGQYDHVQGETLIYDQDMCWGSFYCFVSGQAKCDSAASRSVFLHGAVDIPGAGNIPRKSVELRYVV